MMSNEDNQQLDTSLLLLPKSVLSMILTTLTIEDIIKLEISLSNKGNELLTILNDNEVIYDDVVLDKDECNLDQVMLWIGKRKINIKNLHIESELYSDGKDLTNIGLIGLSLHCNHLISLSLPNCDDIRSKSLYELSKHCINLESLNISNCNLLSEISIIG